MGGHYAWMAVVRLFGPMLGPNFHLYLYNFYLHSLGGNAAVRTILRFLLASPRVTVIAQSPGEVDYYAALARNVPQFVPYCEQDYALPTVLNLVPNARYLFAGGYSNRDYEVVLDCAREFPDQEFVIVPSFLNKELVDEGMPPNITVFRDLNPLEFYGLLEKSAGVIIPLKEDVGSSGQMVAISAMRFGKPVIYADIPAINYYFEENKSGIPYRIGDSGSLIAAVRKLRTLPSTDIAALGERAREAFLAKFTTEVRNEQLLDVVTGVAKVGGVPTRATPGLT